MTRSKLLEQIKVVGDGTSAFTKGTAETLVLVTTGSNKKLQTCDTADGSYEDFVTGLAAGVHNIQIAGAKKYLKSDATTAVAILGDFGTDPVSNS
jgi:hypothetical protein